MVCLPQFSRREAGGSRLRLFGHFFWPRNDAHVVPAFLTLPLCQVLLNRLTAAGEGCTGERVKGLPLYEVIKNLIIIVVAA